MTERTYLQTPEWVASEPEKYRTAFMTFLLDWAMFGAPEDTPAKEYFKLDREDWTDKDTEYIYAKFVEQGYVIPKPSQYTYYLIEYDRPRSLWTTVMRNSDTTSPERYDYSSQGWVVDYDRWDAYFMRDNRNEKISREQAAEVVNRFGGRFYE